MHGLELAFCPVSGAEDGGGRGIRTREGDAPHTFGAVADALLYLGQVGEQTQSLWNPTIYLEPVYWAELQRRKAILGSRIDLEQQYRQEQSVVWPTRPTNDC